jgi:hypothetical protein
VAAEIGKAKELPSPKIIFGIWLLGILVAIAWPVPPELLLGRLTDMMRLVPIILLLSLLFLVFSRLREKESLWKLATIATSAFWLSTVFLFSYLYLRNSVVISFEPGVNIVAGSELTNFGRELMQRNPVHSSQQELLWGTVGNAEILWTRQSIEKNILYLILLREGTLLFAVLWICTTVQAVICGRFKKRVPSSPSHRSEVSIAVKSKSFLKCDNPAPLDTLNERTHAPFALIRPSPLA